MQHSLPRVPSSPGNSPIVQALLATHDDVEPAAQVIGLHVHDLGRHRIVASLPLCLPQQAEGAPQSLLFGRQRSPRPRAWTLCGVGSAGHVTEDVVTAGGLLSASGLRQHNYFLTCWKESSKSVCLETLIFTWLGRAFD